MKQRILFFFLLILLLGTFLRIYHLDQESLWSDEPHSLHHAQQPTLSQVIQDTNQYEFYAPPFYYLLLHYWIEYTGDGLFTIRFFSAIFNIISIFLVFLIGKKLFNSKTGLLAALLFSLSIVEILYAQEIRPFAFFSFLVLLSTYSYLHVIKNKKTLHYLIYFLSSLAMIYTLPFGFLVLFFQNFYLLFNYQTHQNKFKPWFTTQFLLFLFFIPEIPNTIKMYRQNYLLKLTVLVEKYHFPTILQNHLFTTFLLLITIIFFLILTFTFRKQIRQFLKNFNFQKYRSVFLLLLISIGFAYYVLTPFLTRSIFFTRYTLFIMPFIYLLLAAGITKLQKPIQFLVILAILLLCVHTFTIYYPETTKEDWRGTSNFVEQHAQPTDTILLCSWGFAFQYYFTKENKVISSKSYPTFTKIQSEIQNKNYWLIYSTAHRLTPICQEILKQNQPQLEQNFYQMKVLYFTNSQPI